MSLFTILILVAIAAVCGLVGQVIAGFSAGGFVVSTGIGFLGALFGMWIADGLGLPILVPLHVAGVTFPLIWSTLGAATLVAVLGSLAGGKRW